MNQNMPQWMKDQLAEADYSKEIDYAAEAAANRFRTEELKRKPVAKRKRLRLKG